MRTAASKGVFEKSVCRGMGFQPMNHRQDADATKPHGQDARATLQTPFQRMTRARYAAVGGLLCVVASAMVALAGGPPLLVEPYIRVSVLTPHVDLGNPGPLGTYDSAATMVVRVESNCPHGGLVAQLQSLARDGGGLFPPAKVFIRRPQTGEYVPMDGPVNLTGPMGPGRFDLELKFRLNTDLNNPAGTYNGSIVFSCTGTP